MSETLLHKGDCLELMNNIKDKSIDLILCDLPFGTTAHKWDSVLPYDLLNQFCIKLYKIIQVLSILYMKFYLKNKI